MNLDNSGYGKRTQTTIGRSEAAAKALASDFGLSPTSRARVLALVAGAMQKKDDFADFEDIEEQ